MSNEYEDHGEPDNDEFDEGEELGMNGVNEGGLPKGDNGHITDVTPKGEEGNNGTGSFKAYASSLWPEAHWTGGSDIHASIARGGAVPLEFNTQGALLLKSMIQTGFFAYVQRVMNKHVPGMEWIISTEDFENLLILDCHRQINGLPTTETKARLQNPSTGNYFHRVTIWEDKNIVGGVRVWVEQNYDGNCRIGFRYRLERIIPEGQETQEDAALRIRQRTSTQIVEVNEEIVDIKEKAMEAEGEPLVVETFVTE